MGEIPVIVHDFGHLEFPYGGSTFIAALMLAKHMEFSLRGLHQPPTQPMHIQTVCMTATRHFLAAWNVVDDIRGARILELGAGTGFPVITGPQPAYTCSSRPPDCMLCYMLVAPRYGGAVGGRTRRTICHLDGPAVRDALA